MAHGQRHVVVVGSLICGRRLGLQPEGRRWGLGGRGRDVERVVELGALVGGGFEEVADGGLVGPEADAGVLEVDDDGVEVLERLV